MNSVQCFTLIVGDEVALQIITRLEDKGNSLRTYSFTRQQDMTNMTNMCNLKVASEELFTVCNLILRGEEWFTAFSLM